MVTRKGALLGISLVTALLVGCSQDSRERSANTEQSAKIADLNNEIVLLKAQLEQIMAENQELRLTPSAMLVEIRGAVSSGDEASSHAALKRLTDKFPKSEATAIGTKLVGELVATHKAAAAEAARLAALGFKALEVNSTFTGDETVIKLRSAGISNRWNFDAYDDSWHYLESERGQKFVTAKVTVTSNIKNPRLMGLGVYKTDGDKLTRIGSFGYEFSRWDDFATYLGNNADYRNDFSHSGSIPFSIGASVSLDQIAKPLYIIATREGCFTRSEDRFGRPPVNYSSYSCASLPSSLALKDFADGKLGVLSTIK